MITKIKKIDDLFEFLVSNEVFLPALNTDEKDVAVLYNDVNNLFGADKKSQHIISKKFTAIDNLLTRLIYTKEQMILKKSNSRLLKLYTDLVENYVGYPEQISINCGVDLKEISGGVDRLIVLVTHSCQLRCEYCSVRKFYGEMNESVLKKGIDLLFTSNKNEVQLQFFGGEPLLKFDLVKKGVEYAKEISKKTGKKIKFVLTTNGIALTKELADYLIKQNFTIEFSLDGDLETQLKFRKSSSGRDYYGLVFDNLKYLVNKGADYYVISVVTPVNVHNLVKNFNYLLDNGFTNLQINYALGQYWGEKESKILFEQLLEVIDLVKKSSNKLILINSLKNRREPVVLNSEITVDCDGTIYLETGICLEEDFNKLKQDFKIGDINTLKDINCIFATRSRNFKKLVDTYSKEKEEFREIILNNVSLGLKVSRLLKNGIS